MLIKTGTFLVPGLSEAILSRICVCVLCVVCCCVLCAVCAVCVCVCVCVGGEEGWCKQEGKANR
jgi:hypothetical protein